MKNRSAKTYKLMACMIWFYTTLVSIAIVVSIVLSFLNHADAWTIIKQFIYLLSAINAGTILGALLFSHAMNVMCDSNRIEY